jgi:hypothetical protein
VWPIEPKLSRLPFNGESFIFNLNAMMALKVYNSTKNLLAASKRAHLDTVLKQGRNGGVTVPQAGKNDQP